MIRMTIRSTGFPTVVGCVVFAAMVIPAAAAEPVADAQLVTDSVQNTPADNDFLKNTARQIWLILDAVERRHVAVPQRSQLWAIFASTLREDSNNARIDQMIRSSSEDEFVALLTNIWKERQVSRNAVQEFVTALLKKLETEGQLGFMRLLRTKDYAVEEQFRNNRYVGLGVGLNVGSKVAAPQFSVVMPGGAAERGGLESGTSILEVDGKSTKDVPTQTLLDWLRGPLGSDVILKVGTHGGKPEREVTLTRGVVRFDSLQTHEGKSIATGHLRQNLADPIGWVRVNGITASTLHELRAVDRIIRDSDIHAMVLDLHATGRPGDLHHAKVLADGLLNGGTIWNQRTRDTEPRVEHADEEVLFRGLPLVIVVNQSTDDAQAAVAAALQDAGRAVIVGTSPRFNGMIATGVPLTDEFILWMNTTQVSRSRAGKEWPLVPDHDVPQRQFGTLMTTAQQKHRLPIPDPRFSATPPVATKIETTSQRQPAAHSHPMDSDAVSALAPANQTPNTIVRGLQGIQRMLALPTIGPNLITTPAMVAAPAVENADQVVLRIARQLFNSPPSPTD